jgi:hypothetical protein
MPSRTVLPRGERPVLPLLARSAPEHEHTGLQPPRFSEALETRAGLVGNRVPGAHHRCELPRCACGSGGLLLRAPRHWNQMKEENHEEHERGCRGAEPSSPLIHAPPPQHALRHTWVADGDPPRGLATVLGCDRFRRVRGDVRGSEHHPADGVSRGLGQARALSAPGIVVVPGTDVSAPGSSSPNPRAAEAPGAVRSRVRCS